MEDLAHKTKELLDVGLWESAEILARVLVAAPHRSSASHATYHVMLGDALLGKGELQTAEQHYLEALQSRRLATQAQDAVFGEAEKAQVQYKLAQCSAVGDPRKAILILESIPLTHHNAATLAMLGSLYERRGQPEAAHQAYKNCLRKCPYAVEAAVAIAKLGASTDSVVELLKRHNCQVAAPRPSEEHVPAVSSKAPEVLSTPKCSISASTAAGSKLSPPAIPSPAVGDKRVRSASQSPERKRPALNDRAALENAWSSILLGQSSRSSPPGQLPDADENGRRAETPRTRDLHIEVPTNSPASEPQTPSSRPEEPDWVQLLIQGCAAEARRDSSGAVKNFALLVSRSPSNLYPLLRLASAQATAGHTSIAIGLFERCRRLEPANIRQMDDYAMLLYQEGKLKELGQLAFSMAPQHQEASEMLSASPQKASSPQTPPEYWVASSAYLTLCGSCKESCMSDWKDKALLNIQQAMSKGVVHPALHLLKGDLLAKETDKRDQLLAAITEFLTSDSLKPNWMAMLGAAKAARACGNNKEALDFARQAAFSMEPEALALLALVFWDNKRKAREALEWVDTALAKSPNHLFAITTKAKLLCYDGRAGEACNFLFNKVEACASHELHYELGVALRQMHRMKEAVLHFQAALGLNPDHELAQKELKGCEMELKLRQAHKPLTPAAKLREVQEIADKLPDVVTIRLDAEGSALTEATGEIVGAPDSDEPLLPFPRLFNNRIHIHSEGALSEVATPTIPLSAVRFIRRTGDSSPVAEEQHENAEGSGMGEWASLQTESMLDATLRSIVGRIHTLPYHNVQETEAQES